MRFHSKMLASVLTRKRYKVYVAGPMTDYPEYNYPAFYAAAKRLRLEYGWDVVNPAELDELTTEELGDSTQLPAYLRRDFRELVECDGIVLMDGWEDSPGANAELCVARFLAMDAFRLSGGQRNGILYKTHQLPRMQVVTSTMLKYTPAGALSAGVAE